MTEYISADTFGHESAQSEEQLDELFHALRFGAGEDLGSAGGNADFFRERQQNWNCLCLSCLSFPEGICVCSCLYGRRFLDVNETTLQRGDHGLRAVRRVQSHEDGADVALDRGFGDGQDLAYLPIAVSRCEQFQNLAFAVGQL